MEEPIKPKKRMSFIEKIKSKDGDDRISKLVQSLLLNKWKEVEDKRLMINYEDTGNLKNITKFSFNYFTKFSIVVRRTIN